MQKPSSAEVPESPGALTPTSDAQLHFVNRTFVPPLEGLAHRTTGENVQDLHQHEVQEFIVENFLEISSEDRKPKVISFC